MTPEQYPVAYADRPDAAHWKNDHVTWDEIQDWVKTPAKRKACGNYIFATLLVTEKVHKKSAELCEDVHRDNSSIARRSAIFALDIDAPDDGFDLVVEMKLANRSYIMHTTHSSTPSEPRYRLLVAADRDMAPDEYVEASMALASKLGIDQFDDGSFQATRFMFKPAAKKPEWYEHWINEGEPVVVDELLESFEHDLSDKPIPKKHPNKRDPFELDGNIGAFNRAYDDWDLLIEEYRLPYDKVSDDRYQLRGASSEAGMGPVPDAQGLVYSHHANDPAFGKACSAFDLVRLHWFGELDEAAKPGTPINKLPSHIEMLDTATRDPQVVKEIFSDMTDRIDEGSDEPKKDRDWVGQLDLTRQGRFMDVVRNWDLISKHDPVLNQLYFNQLAMAQEILGDRLPWRVLTRNTRTFDGRDLHALRMYIEREYNHRPSRELVEMLVSNKAMERQIHPISEYLDQLVWDGVERVETCLPSAADTRYNRLVARKILVAAVARIFQPGIKWDHALVLYGPQGVGKSTWIERMATIGVPERQLYQYTLGPINSKDTMLAMHMSWIIVSDEGHSLRKSDNDAIKEFLTRSTDVFRMPYDRETVAHPRQCVIWSTTNDDVFLRRQEGNRRFLMVRCPERFDIDAMTPEYVDQLWAEAVHMYKNGEKLYLSDDESLLAELERDPFLEEDTTAGVLEEFLNTPVPDNWWHRSPEARRQWVEDHAQGFEKDGDAKMDKTCSRQLWHEALGQRIIPQKRDLLEISASLKSLGWVSTGLHHFPGYGTQTVFVRKDEIL